MQKIIAPALKNNNIAFKCKESFRIDYYKEHKGIKQSGHADNFLKISEYYYRPVAKIFMETFLSSTILNQSLLWMLLLRLQ